MHLCFSIILPTFYYGCVERSKNVKIKGHDFQQAIFQKYQFLKDYLFRFIYFNNLFFTSIYFNNLFFTSSKEVLDRRFEKSIIFI